MKEIRLIQVVQFKDDLIGLDENGLLWQYSGPDLKWSLFMNPTAEDIGVSGLMRMINNNVIDKDTFEKYGKDILLQHKRKKVKELIEES